MYRKRQDYLDHYYQLLDEWLYEELKNIKDDEERNSVIQGIKAKKKELKERLFENDTYRPEKTYDAKLSIFSDGRVTYLTKSSKRYETKFSIYTNPYKLLRQLAFNSQPPTQGKELVKYMNPSKSDEDRLVRDTIQYIRRKKLCLPKEEDLFIVDKGFFGLKCNVELRAA